MRGQRGWMRVAHHGLHGKGTRSRLSPKPPPFSSLVFFFPSTAPPTCIFFYARILGGSRKKKTYETAERSQASVSVDATTPRVPTLLCRAPDPCTARPSSSTSTPIKPAARFASWWGERKGGGVLSQGWSGEKVPLKYVPTAYVQIHPFTRPCDSPTRTNPTPNSRATTHSVIRSFDVPSNHRGLTEVPPPIISCRTVMCATAPAVTVTQPVPAHGAQTVVHQTNAHSTGPK